MNGLEDIAEAAISAATSLRMLAEGYINETKAIASLQQLRNNIIGTQNASWSNTAYPLVAILNAIGLEYEEPTQKQKCEHIDCYGGAGGYPGHLLREPDPQWTLPINELEHLKNVVRKFLNDPTDENRKILSNVVGTE